MRRIPGRAAVAARGWLAAHRWLLARRAVQAGVFGLFLLGPAAGVWIVKGNLSASLLLETVPLTDPFLLLQSLAARHWPEAAALLGGAIVLAFYLVVGGRAYCGWVCPLNPVTDLAAWLRARLGLAGGGGRPDARLRWALLVLVVALAALTGTAAWELVNPVSIVQRGIVYGLAPAAAVALAVFLFDLLVAPRGWCGRLCPVGAFWGLVGRGALLRVTAPARERCDRCMDCYAACPEPQVIRPALEGAGAPVIRSGMCTNCGRCIDVCPQEVFRYGTRFHGKTMTAGLPGGREETT